MALQDVLAGFANPAASRAAILQRLNIDPQRAGGYGGNTQFDQQMSDLYRQGLQTSASLDTQEGDINRGYEQNLAQSAIDRDKALQTIKGSLAQRGMTFSGAGIDELGQANSQYDRYVANLGADKTAGLGGIGRNRLNLEQGLVSGRQAAESGYGQDLQAFLQQQAVDLWNSVMQQNAAAQGGMGGGGGGGGGYSAPAAPRQQAPSNPDPYGWGKIAASMQTARPPTAMRPAPADTLSRQAAPAKKPLTPIRGRY